MVKKVIHNNSFDFIRFVAAFMVLVGHHFALSGMGSKASSLLASRGVMIFFILSGYLIAKSIRRNNDFCYFLSARILRIMPSLIVSVTFSSIVLLILFKNYSNISSHIVYIITNTFMFHDGVEYFIDGIFQDNIYNKSVNGSLWTLPIEIFCYFLIFLLFFMFPNSKLQTIIIMLIICEFFLRNKEQIDNFKFFNEWFNTRTTLQLVMYFFCGAFVSYLNIKENKLLSFLIGFILFFVSFISNQFTVIGYLGCAFMLIAAGESSIVSWFQKYGDASYGLYIFAFPIQQIAIYYIDNHVASFLVSAIICVILSYSAFHCYEKQALSYKHQLTNKIKNLALR